MKQDDLKLEDIKNDDLTDKQKLFCLYYLRMFNATKAYQKAYGCSYAGAMTGGSKALADPKIAKEVARLRDKMFNQKLLKPMDILQKYIDIAFADMSDYIDFSQVESTKLVKRKEYDEKGNVIAEVEEVVPYTYTKFALHDSSKVDGTLITDLQRGKDGVFRIRLADKMKALEFLVKNYDILSEDEKKRLQIERMKLENAKLEKEIDKLENGDDDKPLVVEIKRADGK